MSRIRRSKYDTRSYSDKVEKITDGEYTVLGEYTKSCNKILMRHNVCGHEWEVCAGNFLSGTRCPECSGKISSSIFEQRVREQVGDEYSIIGNFSSYSSKIRMRHNKCGHEWDIVPEFFVGPKQNRCPRCNRGPVSKKDAEERILSKFGDGIRLIKYNGASKPVTFKHDVCGHEETVIDLGQMLNRNSSDCPICRMAFNKGKTAERLKDKRKAIEEKLSRVCDIEWIDKQEAILTCKKCMKKQHKKSLSINSIFRCDCDKPKKHQKSIFFDMTAKETVDWIEYKSDGNITVKEFIEGTSKSNKCKIKCNRCGHELVTPLIRIAHALENGTDVCPECGDWNNKRKTNKQVQEELDLKYGKNEYVLIGDYKDYDTKIRVRHSCGNEYDIRPNSLLDKSKGKKTKMCAACYSQQKLSYGEKLINEWLKKNNISYKAQYPITDPERKKYRFFYDFAILDDDNNPVAMVEYDGKQHFEPVKHFGGFDRYVKTKRNDMIKNQYCRDHNIAFVRLPYIDSDKVTINKLKAFLGVIFILYGLKENVS